MNDQNLSHKVRIINFLYQNNDRTYTMKELNEELADSMSWDSLKINHRSLIQEGLLSPEEEQRYCTVTGRKVMCYTVVFPPKVMSLLLDARGLIKQKDRKML